jgi:hypothetical protein
MRKIASPAKVAIAAPKNPIRGINATSIIIRMTNARNSKTSQPFWCPEMMRV